MKQLRPTSFVSPRLFLALFLFFFCSILAIGWLSQTPSQEELYGSTGRFFYELKNEFLAQKGFPWWSSNFLQGHSMATYAPCLLPFSIGIICLELFGDFVGIKIFSLLVFPLASLAMFLFVRKLTRNEWTSFFAAVFYVFSASMLVRIGNFEHGAGIYAYIFPPLILWSFLKIAEEKSLRSSALLALSWAGMMLSYTKLAFMFLPMAGLFFVWLLWEQSPEQRWDLLLGTVVALVIVFFLAGLFLLPLVREYQWVAGFRFDPFANWQQAFSIKTMVSLLDRGNELLTGIAPVFQADRGQFYLGLVSFIVVGWTLWKSSTTWLFNTGDGLLLRLFLGMTLLSLWLAHGPFSPFTGTYLFLHSAQNVAPWVLPLFWIMTLLPFFLLERILPQGRYHRVLVVLTSLLYFFVPAFVLLEKFPLYRNIRAPWGFWEVGFFAAAVLSALAFSHLLFTLLPQRYRLTTILFLSFLLLVDSSCYLKNFFTPGLPEQLFSDFDLAQEYLKNSPIEGRVYPLSGRYFYMRTPLESGRGIATEASWTHFQMMGTRALLNAANSSPQAFQSYLNVAGISHILEDKQDPFTSPEAKNVMAQMGPLGFNSEFISVIENPNSLAPAFLAKDYIALDANSFALTGAMLNAAAKLNVVSIELPPDRRYFPDLAGIGSSKTSIQVAQKYSSTKGIPFRRVPFSKPREQATAMQFFFPTFESGWLIITEAWHPDWVATAEGERLPIYRAFSGLMAIPLNNIQGSLQLNFTPPAWYHCCMIIAAFSWLMLFSLFLFFASSKVPKKWKAYWTEPLKERLLFFLEQVTPIK